MSIFHHFLRATLLVRVFQNQSLSAGCDFALFFVFRLRVLRVLTPDPFAPSHPFVSFSLEVEWPGRAVSSNRTRAPP